LNVAVEPLLMLTDRVTAYNGKVEHGHDYQLYLTIENIDHSKIKARHPQSNGICERFHRTIQDEFYAIAFRRKLYSSLDDLQHDLDEWIKLYNEQRPHSGRYCYGKTPIQTFTEALPLAKEKLLNNHISAA
jgi:transposase InsO family protein